MHIDKEVDARGMNCPLPILKAKKALSEMESGQLLIAVPHAVKSPSAYYIVAPHARMSHAPVAAFISWILEEVAAESPAA